MDSDTLHDTNLVNSLTAASISVLANVTNFYKSKIYLEEYIPKVAFLVAVYIGTQWRHSPKNHYYHLFSTVYFAIISIMYSINQLLASPMIHIDENELLFVNNGILQRKAPGQVALDVFGFFVIYTIIFSSSQFLIKYMIICRSSDSISHHRIFFVHLMALLLALTWALLLGHSLRNDCDKDGGMHEVDQELIDRPSLNSHIEGNAMLIVAGCSLLFLNLLSFLIMMYCSHRISEVLKRLQHKSKSIQIRMYQILLIEATIPIALIHVPLTICCVLPLVDLHVEVLLEILPLLFAWYPAISPLLIIWNLRKKNSWRKKNKSSNIVTTVQAKRR